MKEKKFLNSNQKLQHYETPNGQACIMVVVCLEADVSELGRFLTVALDSSMKEINKQCSNRYVVYIDSLPLVYLQPNLLQEEDQIIKSRERINLLIDDNTDLKNRVGQLEKRLNTVYYGRNAVVEINQFSGLVKLNSVHKRNGAQESGYAVHKMNLRKL